MSEMLIESAAAAAARQFPVCIHGHAMSPDNVWTSPDGKRQKCRVCMRIYQQNKHRRAMMQKADPNPELAGSAARQAHENFCSACEAGVHRHRGAIGCLAAVASAPRDFPCACGTRRPLWWRTAIGGWEPGIETPAVQEWCE